MACLSSEDGTLHICRPNGEKRPARKRRRAFWCFSCRKRQMHTLMGFYPTEPSYYGPNFWWECPQCHGEYILFPGTTWDYAGDV